MKSNIRIGRKLKMLRELNDYSQDYVGIKLGISQNAYSRIELNQTNLSAEYAQKLMRYAGLMS